MTDSDKYEVDDVSGTTTTGHEWDGIRELDTPMPRWWLYTFYITIIWAIGYVILYPAIPLITSNTQGTLGYSSRGELAKAIDVAKQEQSQLRAKLTASSLKEITADPKLLSYAKAGGQAAFKVNCVQCHGSGAEGTKGNPNLNDDDWLWGGSLEAIHQTISHGIRFEQDDDTRISEMPAFGKDELLEPAQIEQLAAYVMSFSNKKGSQTDGPGASLFKDNCASCHGETGAGNRDFGAPSLADQIWLYGADKATIVQSIHNSRKGVMPAWAHRLDELTIKQLAIYVHSLGGGE